MSVLAQHKIFLEKKCWYGINLLPGALMRAGPFVLASTMCWTILTDPIRALRAVW